MFSAPHLTYDAKKNRLTLPPAKGKSEGKTCQSEGGLTSSVGGKFALIRQWQVRNDSWTKLLPIL